VPDPWQIEPEWKNETAFIIGGGKSVLRCDLGLIRGRRCIVVNSSYSLVPWADFLIFSDGPWWRFHQDKLRDFKGRILSACISARGPNIWRKIAPRGTATTMTTAIWVAMRLGAAKIVTLGLDNGGGIDGHHHAPHPWTAKHKERYTEKQWQDQWKRQREDLSTLIIPLKESGTSLLNASPGSKLDLWPIVSLEQTL